MPGDSVSACFPDSRSLSPLAHPCWPAPTPIPNLLTEGQDPSPLQGQVRRLLALVAGGHRPTLLPSGSGVSKTHRRRSAGPPRRWLHR